MIYKCLSIVVICTVANLLLKIVKLQEKTFKLKRFLRLVKPRDWWFPYIDFVLYGILPHNPKEAAFIRRKAPRFYYNVITRTLYRQSYDGILLRCLSYKEAQEAFKEAHDGMCRAYQSGPKLGDWLRRLGYYWPKMSLMPSPMLSDAMPVKSTVTLSIKHQNIFIQCPPHDHSQYGEWMILDPSASSILKTSLHLSHNGLLL